MAARGWSRCCVSAQQRRVAIPNGYRRRGLDRPCAPPRGDRVPHRPHGLPAHGARPSRRVRGASWRCRRRQPGSTSLRAHVHLLEAIAGWRAAERDSVELHLAGSLSRADGTRSAVACRGSRAHPRLPGTRRELELVRCADLLFCPMHDLPQGGSALIVPGKTYEYIAAGRPILAAMPAGDARELVRAAGTAASAIRPTSPRCGRSSATSSRPSATAAAPCRSAGDP